MAFGEAADAEAVAVTAVSRQAKKTAAPMRAGRPDIETLEGIKMQHQLNSDEIRDVLEGLCEFYGCPVNKIWLAPSEYDDTYFAHMLVTADFDGPAVIHRGDTHRVYAWGGTWTDALMRLHDAFIAAAPSFEIVKGA